MLFSSFVVCGKRERKAARNTASFRRLVTPLSLSLSLSHAPFLFCFANIDCYMCPFYSSFSVFYMFNIVLVMLMMCIVFIVINLYFYFSSSSSSCSGDMFGACGEYCGPLGE